METTSSNVSLYRINFELYRNDLYRNDFVSKRPGSINPVDKIKLSPPKSPPIQHHRFFRNLPLYSFNVQHCHLRLFCSMTWQANMVRLNLGKTPYSHRIKWGMGTSEVNAGATVWLTNRGTKWGVKILLVALRYRNQDTGFSLGDQLACM